MLDIKRLYVFCGQIVKEEGWRGQDDVSCSLKSEFRERQGQPKERNLRHPSR
jgi:hypothetical protein